MEPRAASGLLASALIRRIEAEGGSAMVLAKGDATAGALLIQISDRGVVGALIERVPGIDGSRWDEAGPTEPAERDAYIARRRARDPDLWVVELDHPRAREIALGIVS